jgi:hypothetical protein
MTQSTLTNNIYSNIFGHVLIRDKSTKEILVDKYNAINYENFSIALAQSLAYQRTGTIEWMCFGNGGSVINGVGEITYFPPNVIGTSAQLYNETYSKVVNDQDLVNNSNPIDNFIVVNHINGTTYSDVIITCTLEYGEPAGQQAFDNSVITNGEFVFNELGLKTYNANSESAGLLISHVIFNPIQKSLNRIIEVVYTIRISIV